jgi:ASC-1-like (ASCH) protein
MRIQIRPHYLEQIQNGEKTVEARVHTRSFKKLAEDDVVIFYNATNSVRCKIISKIVYSSFREMLIEEGLTNCFPDAKTLREGIKTFEKIPKYKQLVKSEGVFALRLEVVT